MAVWTSLRACFLSYNRLYLSIGWFRTKESLAAGGFGDKQGCQHLHQPSQYQRGGESRVLNPSRAQSGLFPGMTRALWGGEEADLKLQLRELMGPEGWAPFSASQSVLSSPGCQYWLQEGRPLPITVWAFHHR
jgi:hypothetical protein